MWPFTKNKIREAWEVREGLDGATGGHPAIAINSGSDIRWDNFLKYSVDHPKLEEVVEISFGEDENGDHVLTLIGVDGKKASLWCKGNKVRAITSY